MYGSGYALGLLIAFVVGLILEYLKRKHNRERVQTKRNQRAERLQSQIKAKQERFKQKRKHPIK